jgi:cytoskeletal protein RodZ
MASIGDILRQARHERKLSLEECARNTKIKQGILEQLEADDFSNLPGPTYTRGFLKMYAEHLGLDSRSLTEAYLQSQGGVRRHGLQLETEANMRARGKGELQLPLRSVVMVVVALTLGAGLIVGIRAMFSKSEAPKEKEPVAASTPVTPVPHSDFEAVYQSKRPAPELLDLPRQ